MVSSLVKGEARRLRSNRTRSIYAKTGVTQCKPCNLCSSWHARNGQNNNTFYLTEGNVRTERVYILKIKKSSDTKLITGI